MTLHLTRPTRQIFVRSACAETHSESLLFARTYAAYYVKDLLLFLSSCTEQHKKYLLALSACVQAYRKHLLYASACAEDRMEYLFVCKRMCRDKYEISGWRMCRRSHGIFVSACQCMSRSSYGKFVSVWKQELVHTFFFRLQEIAKAHTLCLIFLLALCWRFLIRVMQCAI
jgi:hypothetical protein